MPAPTPVQTLRLWDGPAPETPANLPPEKYDETGRVHNVSVPTLAIYLPPKAIATGAALIVCSGGGYGQLAVEKHALGSALAFLPQGIAVLALKYRLTPPSLQVRQDAVADGARAVRLARYHASKWNLNPNRIGMVGHSAGANLILNLLTCFDAGITDSADPIERQSSRPDFVALMSAWPHNQKLEDFVFSADTPPVFMCSALDDQTAPTAFTQGITSRLKQLGLPVRTEIFEQGGHEAFTINQGLHGDWPPMFLAWLKAIKWTRTVVIFGDSITAGSNMPAKEKPRLWVNQIETHSQGQWKLVNQGKGGRPTDSLQEFERILGQQPHLDLLIIALGANDARDINEACVPNAVKNLEAMIAQARIRFGKDLSILLVGPTNIRKDALGPTRPIADQREAKVRELGEAFAKLAATQKCAFVSLNGVVPQTSLSRDGVHPDAAGNDAIAEIMLPAIQRALAG